MSTNSVPDVNDRSRYNFIKNSRKLTKGSRLQINPFRASTAKTVAPQARRYRNQEVIKSNSRSRDINTLNKRPLKSKSYGA